jgi:hypothetical protein
VGRQARAGQARPAQGQQRVSWAKGGERSEHEGERANGLPPKHPSKAARFRRSTRLLCAR